MASTTAVAHGSQKSHTTSSKLEDQAAIAALYVTRYDKSSKDGQAFLDGKQRLSSAGRSPRRGGEIEGTIADDS